MSGFTLSEARAEIKARYDQCDIIEKKYPDPTTMTPEDTEQVKKLLSEIDGLEAKLSTLESAEQRRERIMQGQEKFNRPAPGAIRPGMQVAEQDGEKKYRYTPGTQFTKDRGYRTLREEGVFNSALAQVQLAVQMQDGTSLIEAAKALLRGGSATSGQPFVLEDHQPGFVDILQREINVLDLLPRIPTSSDTVEYVQETTFTNNAAFTAEATGFTATSLGGTGVKPESALAYQTLTATVRTLAHWIPVTNRMLSDAPAIRGMIDGRLLLGLMLTLESQVMTGDGSGENLTGILNTSLNVVSKGTDNQLDALYKGRTAVRLTGHGRPSAYVLHPTDWQTIRLARESAASATPGTYLMGPPSQAGATTLWGLPVVESEAIPQGTGLVGDWAQGATLFDREQAAIRIGTINDQFIRNLQTILAELRCAFVTWRPQVFTKVTGL